VIAATNRNLEEDVAAGRFRSDLYFRLSVVPIQIPSLRDRRSDIIPLAEHFLQSYSSKHGLRATGFAEDAILKLQRYSFPGNVRELEHIVERAVLRAGGRAITSDLIVVEEPATNEQARERELEKLLDLPYHESIQAWERLLLERALKQSNGNKAEAARMLGIHRRLLYEKLGSEGS
jgi:two-component system response regulator AtoC